MKGNVFGFLIKSSFRSVRSEYIVFANTIEEAKEKLNEEIQVLLKEKDGWIWGEPITTLMGEDQMKALKNANIIW